MMHKRSAMVVTLALGLASVGAYAEGTHVMMAPKEIKWGDAPPVLPKGAKIAVLYGDPFKEGTFILRLKLPNNYKIPAHWHPTDEAITVISGSFAMGMGDKLEAKATKPYAAGSFLMMPAKDHHFAQTKGETIVQVTAQGPFVINYVDPAEDPTPKAAAPAAVPK